MVGRTKVCVSNPKNEALKVNVALDGGAPIAFDLPGGELGGSTMTKDFAAR